MDLNYLQASRRIPSYALFNMNPFLNDERFLLFVLVASHKIVCIL